MKAQAENAARQPAARNELALLCKMHRRLWIKYRDVYGAIAGDNLYWSAKAKP